MNTERAITGEQIRAARALLRLDQSELAQRTGLSVETIKRLERIRGRVDAHASTLAMLSMTFAALGVRLTRGEDGAVGVERRSSATQSDDGPDLTLSA